MIRVTSTIGIVDVVKQAGHLVFGHGEVETDVIIEVLSDAVAPVDLPLNTLVGHLSTVVPAISTLSDGRYVRFLDQHVFGDLVEIIG